MLMLVKTFPKQLGYLTSYRESPHPKSGLQQAISEQQMAELAGLNRLDSELYDHASALFKARMRSMRSQLPPAEAKSIFKGMSGTFRLTSGFPGGR